MGFFREYGITMALAGLGLGGAVLWGAQTAGGAVDGAALLEARCAGCHEPRGDGLYRVNTIRKTPEGWDMTLVRMIQWHGADIPARERRQLVQYLSDVQGLAPAETARYRYILERRPNVIETYPDPEVGEICARCHSYARIALQRRDADEWRKLSHTHIGQFFAIDRQAGARGRDWWGIARDRVPDKLGAAYPLETEAWNEWRAAAQPGPEGVWRVVGRRPGRGAYQGSAEIRRAGPGRFTMRTKLTYGDGETLSGESEAFLYTGYEWRGSGKLGDEEIHEVYALSEDGWTLSGRWYLAGHDELGGRFRAVRVDGETAALLAVDPPYLRAGEEAELRIHGTALSGRVNFGDGVEVLEIVARSGDTVVVRVRAGAAAEPGSRAVAVGPAVGFGVFTVYRTIDRLVVTPASAIARVGGGRIAPVGAQFEAAAYLSGTDGVPGTGDDLFVGRVPVKWSASNYDEIAEEYDDVRYAGTMGEDGLFVPAAAGINPERRAGALRRLNNVGVLRISASFEEGGRTLSGEAKLVVTVQRFNDPPIR